ncbi:MAG TPA: 3-dehydroquinate synthase [Chitinophagales bacterium]|nr:3-dehydroquinate synthase [Chitinophagales bacterium]
MSRSISVGTYKVHISNHLKELTKVINKNDFSEVFILVDENSRTHCLPQLLKAVSALKDSHVLEISSGESFKTIDTCKYLWSELLKKSADRHSLFINLGGGVIGDLGGFVASTYMRGIPFINIPTTLLSQVDATLGGKLGIDFNGVKNAVGIFTNPEAVFIHPGFLKTLPDDELLSGFAEMIKHGLISSPVIWNEIKKVNPCRVKNWEPLICKSLLVKKKIVEQDPREKNIRKALNFGHTFGHAFESAALHEGKKLLHGHAVALGIIAESYLSFRLTGLPEKNLNEITHYISFHYRSHIHSDISEINWQRWITHDKKSAGGRFNFTLLKSTGKPVINIDCHRQLMEEAVQFLKSQL